MKNFDEAVKQVLLMFQEQRFPAQLSFTIIRRATEEGSIPSDNWSILNRMIMLMVGRTSDARTYKQWQKAERQVVKGARSFSIIAPITKKSVDPESGEEKVYLIGFRALPVFPLEMTAGKEVWKCNYEPKTIPVSMKNLIMVVERLGGTVKWAPMNGLALGFYSTKDRSITMCSEDFVTLAHETIHFIHDQIDPLKYGDRKKEEIIAELGAAVLCEMMGEQGFEQQSYEYIRRYCSGKDNKAVLATINEVLTTVEKIIGVIVEQIKNS